MPLAALAPVGFGLEEAIFGILPGQLLAGLQTKVRVPQ